MKLGSFHTQTDAHIDLQEHHKAVMEALRARLNYTDDELCEGIRADAERAGAGQPPRQESTAQRVLAIREWAAAVEAQASAFAANSSTITIRSPAELGRVVRARRRKLGLTKKRVVDLTGIDRTTVNGLERDGNAPLEAALLIVNVLGLDTELGPRTVEHAQG